MLLCAVGGGEGDDGSDEDKAMEENEWYEDAGEELHLKGVGVGLIKEENKDSPYNTSTMI